MKFAEKWIWLPKDKYPDNQTTHYSCGGNVIEHHYTVAEFTKKYTFDKVIKKATLRFSGDTTFELYVNDAFLTTGPHLSGGDFLRQGRARDLWYASKLEIEPNSKELCFFARVKMMPIQLCEYSKGKGGFMLTAVVEFEDGTKRIVQTDESWLCRRNGAYIRPSLYDGTIEPDEYVNAKETQNIWFPKDSPLPKRYEEQIYPTNNDITISAGETKTFDCEFDKIYGGFVVAKSSGKINLKIAIYEDVPSLSPDHIAPYLAEGDFNGLDITLDSESYRSLELMSAGKFTVTATNLSNEKAEVNLSLINAHYPITKECKTTTSDEELNAVLDVCRHTLKICRQTIHLDGPRHSEPLACTGDYFIQMHMTAFSYGDMTLAVEDVKRTAELLRQNDGKMFHTTYSLIWVSMLYDIYLYTGDKAVLEECVDGLIFLLQRFERYMGDNGIIENPDDYMFIDWIFIDDISMHHPPKALGQSCLNMFYHGALLAAAKVFEALGDEAMTQDCLTKAKSLKNSINELLFDNEKGLYFMGLNTPEANAGMLTEKNECWIGENIQKRYYLKHANILACLYDICDGDLANEILNRVMTEQFPTDIQPYFAHFLFEALYKQGLSDRFTLDLAEKWKKPTLECPKGLVEGFISPDENYVFDHSHAWGGTPLYSVPKALTGFEILEPGMKKIRICPTLLGLEFARVEIPTPFGDIVVEQKAGDVAAISAPKEIEIIWE